MLIKLLLGCHTEPRANTFMYKAKQHPAGTKREIWDWDGSFYLGSIEEANETFNVVGNVNEVCVCV